MAENQSDPGTTSTTGATDDPLAQAHTKARAEGYRAYLQSLKESLAGIDVENVDTTGLQPHMIGMCGSGCGQFSAGANCSQ